MTAKAVYGIPIGASFKSEGEVLTVLEFITPANLTQPWRALVKSNEIVDHQTVEVKDLQKMERIE
jgi:hypothetical protein